MGSIYSTFDNWCHDKLKIKGWVAIVLLVVIIVAVIAIIGFTFKKTKSTESYTPTANLKSQIQQYVNTWNDMVDSYHGIKKEGYKIRKPAEKYERSRTANNFSYLRANNN